MSLKNRLAIWFAIAMLAGCAGSKEAGEQEAETRPSRTTDPVVYLDPGLAPADALARSVQLYGRSESSLPIMAIGTSDRLTLEFDLMTDRPRPLSVYFYHADRMWRRDLLPAEYMAGFYNDHLLEYRASQAVQSRYVHYAYTFPNENVRFRLSGNYIVRVTEQGEEDEVLFERAFFVSEQAANPDLYLEQVLLGGTAFPGVLPLVRFTPPEAIRGDVFNYDVCFVRNGRIERARCSSEPMLAAQPALQFDLRREQAFFPEAADYFLDVSTFRAGRQIESVDLTRTPYLVRLEPDYAQFPGHPGAPPLNGQTVISGAVPHVADPDVNGDYAEVIFSFIPPDDEPLDGEILVTGSFNNWQYDPDYRMEWVADQSRYEARVLLKQGQYEYRYFSPDRRMRQILSQATPRQDNLYTAFVYFSDNRVSTDRLLAVGGTRSR